MGRPVIKENGKTKNLCKDLNLILICLIMKSKLDRPGITHEIHIGYDL